MGKAVINYFLALYRIIPTEFKRKQQALYHTRNGHGSHGRNGGNASGSDERGKGAGRADWGAYLQHGRRRDCHRRHHNANYERAATKKLGNEYDIC